VAFSVHCRAVTDFIDESAGGGGDGSTASALHSLSPREIQVLKLVAEGSTSKEIARLLGLQPATVDTYRVRIMIKLEARSVAALVRIAIRSGLVDL
jgi:DNA-binding CsgD family transcriptional regulator